MRLGGRNDGVFRRLEFSREHPMRKEVGIVKRVIQYIPLVYKAVKIAKYTAYVVKSLIDLLG